ncbi:uncharacterized protein LOC142564730 isoform X1 [Dermacentor variabilis]|uniref:uncharacterized protein LOC142564730 isoform X1 n=1 Tax=Dermacentor variabilis TaxID=34621 RepID=UPI003F5BE197
MAASGCLDEERSEELEHSVVRKALLDMIRPERIYHQRGEFDYASVRSSAGPGPSSGPGGLAKCLVERLASGGAAPSVLVNNKVVVGAASASSARGLASNAARLDGYDGDQEPAEFATERRNHRYDRAPSTDSVATSSGESCRSSSDSASSAPCSPESVISDSGGAEGLPDSVAILVSGALADAVPPDSGFNLSRLLLPQQHRQGETAAEARKRDLRLVDEVVAAASATTTESRPVSSPPASPRPQSSALAAAAISFSSASCLSSSSATFTATATSPATASSAVERFLANSSASTVGPLVPPSLSPLATSPVASVSVSSSSCSAATAVSHSASCVTGSATTSSGSVGLQASPSASAKCGVSQAAAVSPASTPGACAKSSRRKRRQSGDAKKRDSPLVSDDDAEDEDICRRREAEVESLLRHCIDLVADRLDPQHCISSLRGYRKDHQSEAHRHSETSGHQASPSRSCRHQDHQPHCNIHHQERLTLGEGAEVACGWPQERRSSCHVQEREHRHTVHDHHHQRNQHHSHHSQPQDHKPQDQETHAKHHPHRNTHLENHHHHEHLRPPSPILPPCSPECSSSSTSSSSSSSTSSNCGSIPGDDDSQCLLATQTTAEDDAASAAALSMSVSSTPTTDSLALTTPPTISLSTSTSSSTTTAAVFSAPSSSLLATAPSPCSSSQSAASVAAEDGLFTCRWLDCEMRLRSEDALGDHVRGAHVDSQTRDQGVYLCRWQGCKVFERRSCSRQWLERHVTLSHCGSRPFPCIVAGCGQRFGSQAALQRHVNAHFERSLNGSGPVPSGGGAGSSASGSGVTSGGSLLGSRGLGSKELASGDSPLKLLRLRKKLKCRRRAWATVKHPDFFDAGVMEELRHRLTEVSAPQSPAEPHSWNGSTVTFHATVMARRKENTGKVKVLLHWVPEHILPDSWEPENQSTEKVVALSSLSADDLHTLNLWPKDLPTPCQGLSGSRRRKRK